MNQKNIRPQLRSSLFGPKQSQINPIADQALVAPSPIAFFDEFDEAVETSLQVHIPDNGELSANGQYYAPLTSLFCQGGEAYWTVASGGNYRALFEAPNLFEPTYMDTVAYYDTIPGNAIALNFHLSSGGSGHGGNWQIFSHAVAGANGLRLYFAGAQRAFISQPTFSTFVDYRITVEKIAGTLYSFKYQDVELVQYDLGAPVLNDNFFGIWGYQYMHHKYLNVY